MTYTAVKRIVFIVFCLVLCAGMVGIASAAAEREHITNKELADTGYVPSEPVQNANYLPVGEAGAAHHAFSGALVLSATEMKVKPDFKARKVLGKDPQIFPGAALQFYSYNDDLVPVTQEVITPSPELSNNSYWELVVQPGKVWSEPGDNGWSRASFPFGLMHSLENETHNGIATLLFNENSVSAARFQIVTQTAPYYIATHFIAWGQIPASYDRTPIENLDNLKSAWADEKANRFPMAQWSVLEKKVGKDKLAGFEGKMSPEYLVWSALVYDGVLYYKPCKTPYGDFPFLGNMRLGVWSLTKSIGPGIGMLRLAQKFGPYVFNLKIKDYVDLSPSHNGWDQVTFGDALNMATGIGGGTNTAHSSMGVDYLDKTYDAWYTTPSAEEKLKKVSETGNYPWGPGEVARYRDRDMFTLGAAMDAFLKAMEGPDADIWKMIAEEVFKPIHIYHAPTTRTIERDGKLGLPLMAWGWFPNLDDVAKVADLLHKRGNYQGNQILNLERTTALFSTSGSFSQNRNWEYGARRYKMAFHYMPYPDYTGKIMYCPYASGWIGNKILLMPGNMTGIRMSNAWPAPDEDQNAAADPTSMAKVAGRLRPFSR